MQLDNAATPSRSGDEPAWHVENTRLTVPPGSRDHTRGPASAAVVLVEYGDYECPYCSGAEQIVGDVERQLADAVLYVFRHFPVRDAHPRAQLAAEAAEAAGAQGKFWEMHRWLFGHQRELEMPHLVAQAAALGLDVGRIESELADHTHTKRVRDDVSSGRESGVPGTPTFFINGIRHVGLQAGGPVERDQDSMSKTSS